MLMLDYRKGGRGLADFMNSLLEGIELESDTRGGDKSDINIFLKSKKTDYTSYLVHLCQFT